MYHILPGIANNETPRRSGTFHLLNTTRPMEYKIVLSTRLETYFIRKISQIALQDGHSRDIVSDVATLQIETNKIRAIKLMRKGMGESAPCQGSKRARVVVGQARHNGSLL